jgi:hypothetical protein
MQIGRWERYELNVGAWAFGRQAEADLVLGNSVAWVPLSRIVSKSVAEATVEFLEREAGVRLARQHQ